MAVSLPILHHTPVADVPDIVDRLRKTFHKQKTKPLGYRLVQLRKLYWGLRDNEEALFEALRLDLGKPGFESYAGEVGWCQNDIIYVCDRLEKWAGDEKPADVPLLNAPLSPRIRKDPLGVVLVIGAFNYPVQLSLGPFIGAIAAGCTALLKPSEVAPHTAAVLQKTIEESLDPSAYAVVQGGASETTELLNQKWDKIFYTGSSHVGKIVAKKAAETLTPVTLELGGRNPAIVTKHADPGLAARRLLWGKVGNAGQVCLAENYVLVDKEILPSFVAELEVALTEFFPRGAKESPDYARIVNQRHYHRIKSMLDQTGGKILFGGAADENERFVEPTVVQVDSIEDSLMQDEIFGPLLPIYPVDDLDDAIRVANEVSDTPLALYPFGNKDETERALREIRSGGASINDSYLHATIPMIPFGGVGQSGHGSYRGKASFECFSHRRTVITSPSWMEFMLSIRYPPYAGKVRRLRRLQGLKPNFDREGRVRLSWLGWLLSFAAIGQGSKPVEDHPSASQGGDVVAKRGMPPSHPSLLIGDQRRHRPWSAPAL